jgi:hypothetical protein
MAAMSVMPRPRHAGQHVRTSLQTGCGCGQAAEQLCAAVTDSFGASDGELRLLSCRISSPGEYRLATLVAEQPGKVRAMVSNLEPACRKKIFSLHAQGKPGRNCWTGPG